MTSCVYTANELFLADIGARKIYRYSTDGEYTYKGVFASGHKFNRMTIGDGCLYVGILPTNQILIYSLTSGEIVNQFKTGGSPRGMAFDSKNQLHVVLWKTKTVETYNANGKKLGQRIYQELNQPDGLVIDYYDNLYIANRHNPSTVTVYTSSGLLVNTIRGFKSAIDVIEYELKQMVVIDILADKATMYR